MMQLQIWGAAGLAVLTALFSGVAEHRRRRRRDLERVGLMPWMAIQMAALFAALVLASVAFNTR